MSPKTDVCPVCEQHKDHIQSAMTENDKLAALDKYSAHLNEVKVERQLYNQCVTNARTEVAEQPVPVQAASPMSTELNNVHYTFDYSQAVSIPHHVCQVGPLYFATPRKIQLFGVAMEGIKKQINFLVDEDSTPGKNGTHVKGAIGVISMLHYCFENFGLGEKECHLHCDNASGENKNKFMLAYLLWRTLSGKHSQIHLHMQVPYHGKSLVDAGFAYIKKLYRRSEVDSLDQLASVVRKSATSNEVVVFGGADGEWLDWKTFASNYFIPFKGIRKFRHFAFQADKPGIVVAKEVPDSPGTELKLLKAGVDIDAIQPPRVIPAAGLTRERIQYLFKFIRPFVRAPYKDVVAPSPNAQEE
ncbi:uncharacterized protein LOC125655365 [Ostrea edulis]|uniref:uncharacterized protein LOC125655365 n=1 Tax=Ostrea edulis TaxID=37623 RepID=UPI0024AF607A|nr:uncharacterized protein LOC125655365 [Ostrea edulis]